MTTQVNKVITLYDKKTSMRLTFFEWKILDSICRAEKLKRKSILELIDKNRDTKIGLTAAVRLFTLLYLYNFGNKTNSVNDIYKVFNAMKK